MSEQQVPIGPTVDHSSYLGASDVGIITGETDLDRDELDVWAEKTGQREFVGTEAMDLGNAFERPMLDVYSKRAGSKLLFPGTLRHPAHDWAGATPDAVESFDDQPGLYALDAKLVGRWMAKYWGEPEDGADGVPPSVLLQLHWQAWLLRANGFPVTFGRAVACFGTEIKAYSIPIDDAMIDALVEIGHAWWQRHVVKGEIPEGRRRREIAELIHPRNVRDDLISPTDRAMDLAYEYDEARKAETASKREKERIGAKLCEEIGDGAGFANSRIKVSWIKPGKGRVSWKDLAESLGPTEAQIEAHRKAPGARGLDVKIRRERNG